ncbi:proline-trna synthetase [Aphelenchoides avenae]|nr:proline-trna synthetase [Aphelenchus avenae]
MLYRASRLHLNLLAKQKDPSRKPCLSYELMRCNRLIDSFGHGLFAFLPLGRRVVKKLERIIATELTRIGAEEMEMPVLGAEELWQQSGRWNAMDKHILKLTDHDDRSYCLQPTAEEMATTVAKRFGALNQKDLPLMLFQSTQKFRDEEPRLGLLRAKQFQMNDLYTFDAHESAAQETYEKVTSSYWKIFRDVLRLPAVYRVDADVGDIGGTTSHEFHIPNAHGQDTLRLCDPCADEPATQRIARRLKPTEALGCQACKQRPASSIVNTFEIGHTFQLGTKYTETFEALNVDGKPYKMCCFGIGVTRTVAASIDTLSVSDKALRLPDAISPFNLAVVIPKVVNDDTHFSLRFADDLINNLGRINGLDVLVDDRTDKGIGKRLRELNSIGVPHVLVVPYKKYDISPFDVPYVEYFKTLPFEDAMRVEGHLTHSEVFRMVQNL